MNDVMSRSEAAALLMDMSRRGGYHAKRPRRCSWAFARS